jgi:hypothetical protein
VTANHCIRDRESGNICKAFTLLQFGFYFIAKAVGLKAYRSKITTMFIIKASVLVVLIINIDESAICQSYIFITS